MDKILIHACPQRMWYVEGFLIPSLKEQGLTDIEVACDTEGKGNLAKCMEIFAECGKRDGDTWHLQDDVLICRDFAERIDVEEDKVVCGFCHTLFEPFDRPMPGYQPAVFMYNSFPCIRIPNRIAGECAEWFYTDARHRPNYKMWVESNIHDDGFWHDFFVECHGHDFVWNLVPNLVEHVDWLIGGSTINTWRGYVCRSAYWDDEELVKELAERITNYKLSQRRTNKWQ